MSSENYALKAGCVVHGKSYNYVIEEVLGQGTFGISYLARVRMKGALGELDSDVRVALKEFFMRDFNGRDNTSVTYSSKDGAFSYYKEKFIHEAENLGKLKHDGIVKVVELFEENSTAYYAMEFISKSSLDNHIKKKSRLSADESVAFARQIGEALGFMHAQQMLHLDLKPGNVMINDKGKAVLIDFGLSKRFDAYGNPETSTTIGHGTPGYAPVEQSHYQGREGGTLPATMDIYALGGTMFKMLTGCRPPEASSILNDGFPTDEFKFANVPDDLTRIVQKCMAPLRKDRYQTVKEVLDALANADLGNEDTVTITSRGFYPVKKTGSHADEVIVERVPVRESVDMPDVITIRLMPNNKRGIGYGIKLSDLDLTGGMSNSITAWRDGKMSNARKFQSGINPDVKRFLEEHGFLSTVHWENESATSPIDKTFGTDVSITFEYIGEGKQFKRRVEHAHSSYNNLLLNEVEQLVNTTSLHKILEGFLESDVSRVEVRPHTDKIELRFLPQTPLFTYGYRLILTPDKLKIAAGGSDVAVKTHKKFLIRDIDRSVFDAVLTEIGKLDECKVVRLLNRYEYSESPSEFDIDLYCNEESKPYSHLHSESLGGLSGGNLCGYAAELAMRFEKLIPDFDNLREEASRLKQNNDDNDTEEKKPKPAKKGDLPMLVFLTIVVAVLCLPVYFFINQADKYFYWLWGSLGLMELCIAWFCMIVTPDTKKTGNTETVLLLTGCADILAYIVIWICQMVTWWA